MDAETAARLAQAGRDQMAEGDSEDKATIAKLHKALEDAVELADDGWGYASIYFREKYAVADDFDRLHRILAEHAAPGTPYYGWGEDGP